MKLFEKISTFTAGMAHSLVNEAIKENSIPFLEQHLRKLQEAKDEMLNQAAHAKADVDLALHQITAIEAQIKSGKDNAAQLLGDDDPDNDVHADTFLANVAKNEERLAGKKTELEELRKTAADLAAVVEQLEEKHTQALERLSELRRKDKASKSREKAAGAIEVAASVMGEADDVDDMGRAVEHRDAASRARLENALGSVSGSSAANKAVAKSKEQQRIAELRAELAKKKA